jgi:L-lactate utilization protein LutB
VDINIPDMLLMLRRDLQKEQDAFWKLGMKAWAFGFSHPLLYGIGGKASSAASRAAASMLNDGETIDKLPPPFNAWTEYRDFPAFAPQSFHDWWKANRGDGDGA